MKLLPGTTRVTSGNKTRALLAFLISLWTPLGAWSAEVPPEQGGPGTVDPNTVGVRETVHFALGADTDTTHYAKPYGIDAAGNYYLGSEVGASSGRGYLSKFDAAGNLIWRRQRNVTTVSVSDPTAPGGSRTSYREDFSPDQTPREINANEGSNYAVLAAVAVDSAGNVFVGYNEANNFTRDYTPYTLVVKFDSAGTFQWRGATPNGAGYDSSLYSFSLLQRLVPGNDGSVVAVTNNFERSNGDSQTVLVKFAANGDRIRDNRFGRIQSGQKLYNSSFDDVSVDALGNINLLTSEYAAPGINPPVPAQPSSVIRKLDPNGNLLARRDSPSQRDPQTRKADFLSRLKADDAGNLYVAGIYDRQRPSFSDPDQGESKQLLLKLDSQLNFLWRTLGPQPKQTSSDQVGVAIMDLALSPNGVTIGGNTISTGIAPSNNDYRWEVARYALEDGHLLWHRLYQAPATNPNQGFNDTLSALRVDSIGNVFAAGSVSVTTTGVRGALIKYADNGDLQFVKLFPDGFSTQPSTLMLNAGNGRPTFYAGANTTKFDLRVIEFDNPAIVLGPPDIFGNISTRGRIGTGDNVLIGGVIVNGPAGSTKKVLFRAIGPSLTQAGLSGALNDTTLILTDSSGHQNTNDDWKKSQDPNVTDAQQAAAVSSSLPPSNDKESALVATLAPGAYTVIVGGKGSTGVGLVEVYDLDQASSAQLVNISTRGKIETGDNVMIGGVIVLGNDPTRMVVRAIGPSLVAAGIQNAMQEPGLTMYNANGAVIASNDDWKAVDGTTPSQSQETEIRQTDLMPNNDRESAVIVSVLPGAYTIIVKGKNGGTGVGLVEAYKLP